MGLPEKTVTKDIDDKFSNYKQITQNIITQVNCPYRVFTEDCEAEDVISEYGKALERGESEGFHPILVYSDSTLEDWLTILEDENNYSKEAVLAGDSSNGKEILDKRYKEYMGDIEEFFDESGEGNIEEFMGELENGEAIPYPVSFMKFSGDGIEETIMFEIPVDKPWEVIAWLPVGGWNECPPAEEMMAICRYWFEKYGAKPAALTHDVLEFVLDNPVENDDEAWALAKEHYAFSPDRVDQCTQTGTLGEVADCLRQSTAWYFWWD